MKKYYCEMVTVNGILDFKVEMWYENNHCQVYSCDNPLFDGYIAEASKRFHDEVKRLCEVAGKYGMSWNVFRKHGIGWKEITSRYIETEQGR